MVRRGAARGLVATSLGLVLAAGCSAISGLGSLRFDEGSSSSTGAAGGAGDVGGGGSGACDDAKDCNPRPCIEVSCVHHRCVVAVSDAETKCPTGVCDGHGSCVGCVNAGDCTVPECSVSACASRACVVSPAPVDTPCNAEGGAFCDGMGNCVACNSASECGPNGTCDVDHTCQDLCDDGLKNYDETDVDCGGSCPPCAKGKLCAVATDCTSGFCVDGICCNNACTDVCATCGVSFDKGTCRPQIPGETDPGVCDATHGTCGSACACGQGGVCLRADGAPCSQDAQCASDSCGIDDICGE